MRPGISGAPRSGNAQAWAPRLAQGDDGACATYDRGYAVYGDATARDVCRVYRPGVARRDSLHGRRRIHERSLVPTNYSPLRPSTARFRSASRLNARPAASWNESCLKSDSTIGESIDETLQMSRYLPGDVVSRRKGFVMHRGIALGDGRVLHNTPFKGEHISSEEEFSAGQRLYVTRMDRTARQRALLHAQMDAAGRPYHLLANNCEHTVSRAIGGEAESPQLRGWVVGLVAGAALLALTRSPAAAAAGFAAARGWLASDR